MNNIFLSQYNIEYEIGDTVYLKTDYDQLERIIIAISLKPNNSVLYQLAQGDKESWHYSIEIQKERDIIKLTTN